MNSAKYSMIIQTFKTQNAKMYVIYRIQKIKVNQNNIYGKLLYFYAIF